MPGSGEFIDLAKIILDQFEAKQGHTNDLSKTFNDVKDISRFGADVDVNYGHLKAWNIFDCIQQR